MINSPPTFVDGLAERSVEYLRVHVQRRVDVGVTHQLRDNQSCEPGGNFIHLGHHLLVMDSDPPIAQRDLPPSANADPTLFFDVVNENGPADQVPDHFLFCYANPNIVGKVPADTYEIVLRVDGGNVSATKKFRVRKSWNPTNGAGKLTMEAV